MSEEYSINKYGGDTENILKNTFTALIEGLTGGVISKKADYQLTAGRILQSLVKGEFLNQLTIEWKEYREKGKIKDDYQDTTQHIECLQEMLSFLDSDIPDEKRFSLLKKIFLVTASEEITNREDVLPQQLMRICKNLTSGEVLVLLGAYSYNLNEDNSERIRTYAADWLRNIAEATELKYVELVELHERGLMDKNLLTKRMYGDKSGVKLGENYRLTSLGVEICKFVEKFDEMNSA